MTDELRRIEEQLRQIEVPRIRRHEEIRERRREIQINRPENPNDILRQLPKSKLQNIERLDDDKKKCIICLEDFKTNDKVIYLPCIHFFHEICIKNWIKRKQSCPICKHEINNNNLI